MWSRRSISLMTISSRSFIARVTPKRIGGNANTSQKTSNTIPLSTKIPSKKFTPIEKKQKIEKIEKIVSPPPVKKIKTTTTTPSPTKMSPKQMAKLTQPRAPAKKPPPPPRTKTPSMKPPSELTDKQIQLILKKFPDPCLPIKPLPAYIEFSMELRIKYPDKAVSLSLGDFAKLASVEWKKLSENQRTKRTQKTRQAKLEWDGLMKIYHENDLHNKWMPLAIKLSIDDKICKQKQK